MLYAKVLVAEAVVERKSRLDHPTVLQISSPIMVTVAARETGRSSRQTQGAIRSLDQPRHWVTLAREFPLCVHRNLKQREIAAHQVCEPGGRVSAQLLNRL